MKVVDVSTPEQRAELRKLAEAATEGPWTVEAFPHRVDIDAPGGGWLFRAGAYPHFDDDMEDFDATVADAQFIAAARTAVPALLDEVERLTTERNAA